MQKVGKDVTATDQWKTIADAYASSIDGLYHQQRIRAIMGLMPDLPGRTYVDFGCGEGVFCELLSAAGAKMVAGIDIEESLLEKARKRIPGRYVHGGVEALEHVTHCDVLLAANVLAYMTAEEERAFYEHARKVARYLVVSHSNSLFDLYTLNAYTVAFFKEHFGTDVSTLVTYPDKPSRVSFNVREHPLAYPEKLRPYGFEIQATEFMNYHPAPPLLSNEDPDDMRRARPSMENVPHWKRMFQCSMFAVRARNLATLS
jgi:2-polyprenyl-3-methyl-5-hydroxy-6-metoxy-1,4-benzoquinol methylase